MVAKWDATTTWADGSPKIQHDEPLEDSIIYMSLTFPKVSKKKAEQIIKAAMAIAGTISHDVYIDVSVDEEE